MIGNWSETLCGRFRKRITSTGRIGLQWRENRYQPWRIRDHYDEFEDLDDALAAQAELLADEFNHHDNHVEPTWQELASIVAMNAALEVDYDCELFDSSNMAAAYDACHEALGCGAFATSA